MRGIFSRVHNRSIHSGRKDSLAREVQRAVVTVDGIAVWVIRADSLNGDPRVPIGGNEPGPWLAPQHIGSRVHSSSDY